ncbi:MAG: hypothetical protein ACE5K4_11720 [Candidatus Hydrothermarchaeota archaeon]
MSGTVQFRLTEKMLDIVLFFFKHIGERFGVRDIYREIGGGKGYISEAHLLLPK